MKTRFNWIFSASIAVIFVLGGAAVSFAQEGRFFGGNGITVFADKEFRGNTQTFENDVPDLSSYGMDRRISSFRVGNNQEWQICDGKNYSGRCASVSGEEYDLSINGWNDRIRSLRRTSGSGGGGWGSGGQTSTPPSWAQGTFYGTAPNGTQIILTLERSGRATANIGGSLTYGTYYNGYLNMNGNRARVQQSGNGFRTVSTMNGETIFYSRNNSGGGGWGGNQSRPPSWARGTFYGTAPNGSRIMLTINSDGAISANIGGNISNGYYQSGNVININGNTARVYRQGDGFRTVSTMNNETIIYSKNSGGWGGSGGSVPSWAVGRFRGNSPQDGSQIIITIQSNGNVTVNIGGNMNYGSLNGSTLSINGATSTVYRNGNGIRTVSNGDGQTINYFRY